MQGRSRAKPVDCIFRWICRADHKHLTNKSAKYPKLRV